MNAPDSPDTEWAPATAVDPGAPAIDDDTARRTAEIRSEIAQTRVEMSETIGALQEKLTPGNLVAQAGDSVKEAAGRKVQQMANTAGDVADQVIDSSFVQTVRTNPIPAAMIGIGTAWLLLKRRSGSDRSYRAGSSSYRQGGDWRRYRGQSSYGSSAYGGGRDTSSAGAYGSEGGGYAGSASYGSTGGYGTTGEFGGTSSGIGSGSAQAVGTSGTSQYGTGGTDYSSGSESRGVYGGGSQGSYGGSSGGVSGGYRSQRSGMSFERVIRDNPLALGAAAVLIGAAIGMSIPSTEAENEFMGDTRDNMIDKAREMASDAANKVSDVAGQVQNAASSAAQTAGSSGGQNTGGSTGSSGSNAGSTTGSAGSMGGTADISGSAWDTTGGSTAGGTGTGSTDTRTSRKRTTGSSGV